MSRAQVPASPADDLSARRSRRDRIAADSPISSDLAAFMQSGIAVCVASATANRQPVVGFALACRVDDQGLVRVLLRRPANLKLLRAIEQGGAVAVTMTRPHDERSIQIKAPSARVAGARADDPPEVGRQTIGLRDDLIGVGYDMAFSAGYVAHEPDELVAIELRPDRVFVQTPGPGAGSELAP